MTVPGSLEASTKPPLRLRLAARLTVMVARVLARLAPRKIRRILLRIRQGATTATYTQACTARNAVVSVSALCAGQGCVQRSIATALLCRLQGTWPTWCVGVRTEPFTAHAWVETNGRPVGERFEPGYYFRLMEIPPIEATDDAQATSRQQLQKGSRPAPGE